MESQLCPVDKYMSQSSITILVQLQTQVYFSMSLQYAG